MMCDAVLPCCTSPPCDQMMFKQVLDSVPERDAWASGIMSEEVRAEKHTHTRSHCHAQQLAVLGVQVLSRYLATVLLPAGVNATWMMVQHCGGWHARLALHQLIPLHA